MIGLASRPPTCDHRPPTADTLEDEGLDKKAKTPKKPKQNKSKSGDAKAK
jgi:hypothetical protein